MKLKDLTPGTFFLCKACYNWNCVLLIAEKSKQGPIIEEASLIRVSDKKESCRWNFDCAFNADHKFCSFKKLR